MSETDKTAELRCEEAQGLLSRDLDGELGSAGLAPERARLRAQLAAHLAACSACAREKAALEGTDGLLRDALPADAFGEGFAREVLKNVGREIDQRTARPARQTSSPRGLFVAFTGKLGSRGAGILAASAAAALFFAFVTGSFPLAPAPEAPHSPAGPAIVARAYGKGLRVSNETGSHESGSHESGSHALAPGEIVHADDRVLNASGAGTLFLGEPSRVAAFDPERGTDPELTRIDLRPDTTLSFHVERDGGTTVSLAGIGGVAYFEVAKQEHPFRVASSSLMATVLGTKFVVEASSQSSTVAVLEGRVRVTTATQHVVLSARQEASVAHAQGILVARPSQPRTHLAWNPRVLASLPADVSSAPGPGPAPTQSPIRPTGPGQPVIDPDLDTPVK